MRTIESLAVARNMQDRKLKSPATREFQTTIVGIMGHDLRQSLQVIQGTYGLLGSRLQDMPERAWLDRGERAVSNLTEQLNCLVDAFHLAEHSNVVEVTSVGIGPLFARLQDENGDMAVQRGIDFRTVATTAHVMSNPVLFGCILRNLLTNALRYTERGGRILVGCRRQANEVRIDVHDTGIGIPQDRVSHIFDSFTRLAPGYGNGLGIGLSIVRRAIEVLGHRIEVRSVVGEGSVFSIYAPAEVAIQRTQP